MKDKEAGKVPHSSIDTEAGWTKSGWHGWVYGWKLHLATTVAGVWIPLAARLIPANVSDNRITPLLIEELPGEARFVLGDTHYNAPEVRAACIESERFLVASGRALYPHTDAGVEVRRIFHRLRYVAIENFNEHFKAIFDAHGAVPTKGRLDTAPRFALGAITLGRVWAEMWARMENDCAPELLEAYEQQVEKTKTLPLDRPAPPTSSAKWRSRSPSERPQPLTAQGSLEPALCGG
jgi:hypothetical protein